MSRDYQEKFLREQIEEYEELLREHAAIRQRTATLSRRLKSRKPRGKSG